jgi:hypothetical protein
MMRPFALQITAGDFAFAGHGHPGRRHTAISFVACCLNSLAAFSIAAI